MSATQTQVKPERRRSREIFEKAEKVLVGGVNSPVRAFRSVGGEPLIIERGSGQYLYDADGNELLDYVCSWGAMLLGHAHPAVTAAIAEQANARNELWRDHRIGVGTGHADHQGDSVSGEGTFCFERHGSDDERGAAGARGDEARLDHQI